MKKPAWIALATAGAVLATAAWVRDYYWVGHMRRMSGQASLDKVSCYNCHLVATERLPWAKPHAKHDSPAGMVASADGTRLFIAMDDKDEIAEADVVARRVLRRVRVPGRPFGLALDPAGNRLFVACRDADRVAVLDARTLKETASAAVGMAPVAVAFCQSPAGERLVVANSMSDDVSVLTVSPLAEISRSPQRRHPTAPACSSQTAWSASPPSNPSRNRKSPSWTPPAAGWSAATRLNRPIFPKAPAPCPPAAGSSPPWSRSETSCPSFRWPTVG
jgi:YVTN family beta-propeller protein